MRLSISAGQNLIDKIAHKIGCRITPNTNKKMQQFIAVGRPDKLQELKQSEIFKDDNFQIDLENQNQLIINDLYVNQLRTSELGTLLLFADEIGSTQDFVCENRNKLINGTVVLANVQVKGRGRGKNEWRSPPGCLMFTFITKCRMEGKWVPHVQYAVCMAIVDAVKKLTKKDDIGLQIKWPNDIYFNNQKICGVLSQSFFGGGDYQFVIGAGFNLDNNEPTVCLNDILEKQYGIERLKREQLLAEIMNFLEHYIQTIQFEGFGPLQEQYLKCWMHSGQQLMLEEQDSEGNIIQVGVIICGLSNSGFLLAQEQTTGQHYELHPNGNSLDMMKGLIRKKFQ